MSGNRILISQTEKLGITSGDIEIIEYVDTNKFLFALGVEKTAKQVEFDPDNYKCIDTQLQY